MIKKIVKIKNPNDKNMISDDLKYWLSKLSEERVASEIIFHPDALTGRPRREITDAGLFNSL